MVKETLVSQTLLFLKLLICCLFSCNFDIKPDINIQNIICGDKDYCKIIHNNKLLTYDGAHLTKYGAKYLGSLIFNKNYKLNSIFK